MKVRLAYLAAAIVCIGLGLLIRLSQFGLPWAVGKYGGSALWAGMVYLILRAILPRQRGLFVAVVAAILVALGEALQLLSVPWFDAMRATTLGHLIFGRTFAVEDIVAYWIGIILAAIGDEFVRRRDRRSSLPEG